MVFKVDNMKFVDSEFQCKTTANPLLKCKKYVKEVSTVLKNDRIVCYLQ